MVSKTTPKRYEPISKSRALNASILTVLSLVFLCTWIYHGIWCIKVMINKTYGSFLNNLIYGPGTLLLSIGVGSRFISWVNIRLLDNSIEEDYKKYI